MSRKIKKSVSILLALVMLCGVLAVAPVTVSAAVTTYTAGGGTGGKYTFNTETGELHLLSAESDGTGVFTNTAWQTHVGNNNMNWTVNGFAKNAVKKVTAEKGVKFTGDCTRMFHSFFCTSIDLSNVDAREVTNMAQMFQACINLETLDLSGDFETSSEVYNMGNMLQGCSALTSVVFGEKYNTSGVQYFDNMFNGCSKLTSLDLHVFDSGSAKNMGLMFNNCSSLTTLIFPNQNAVNATNMGKMFYGCSALTTLDITGLKTSKLTSMNEMFNGCSSLESLDLSGGTIETGAQASLGYMFANCSSLTSLNLSSFNMSKGTSASNMFSFCGQLKEITISDKFIGGIKSEMLLTQGGGVGWRISPSDDAERVSGNGFFAVIEQPAAETTYKWIEYSTVTWKNWDNNTLDNEDYKLEAPAIHPTYKNGTPTRTDTYGKAYIFAGWTDGENTYGLDDDLPYVTKDITYTALYNEIDTLYTLNYIYQGRKGGNKGGYVGDNEADDEKTYTVIAEVHPSKLDESGKPQAKVLVDNAPVVNDPYKNCRWTFTDEYVEFDSENKVVTITANQPERKYSVIFKDSNGETTDAFRVKLNEYVKKNDSFITVPETDGSGTKFAYWSVVQNGKETARCFERRFNLRVTGDSVVTAHYGEAENLVTLSEAEISRQQFTDANGNQKDLLYADFITAYMDKQEMKLSQKTDSEYKTGMIVQYSPDVKVAKENAPEATLSASDKIEFANGDLLSKENAKTIANGGTVGGKYSYLTAPIDNTKYNDKNRLNKSLVFTNTETARRLVLCAYYYVYNVKTDEIEMTVPVYFYLYDAGNAVNTES